MEQTLGLISYYLDVVYIIKTLSKATEEKVYPVQLLLKSPNNISKE